MKLSVIQDYIQQELYKIHNSMNTFIEKKTDKEDLFNDLLNKWYDPKKL